jgi:hypothetical protein
MMRKEWGGSICQASGRVCRGEGVRRSSTGRWGMYRRRKSRLRWCRDEMSGKKRYRGCGHVVEE